MIYELKYIIKIKIYLLFELSHKIKNRKIINI